MRTLPLTLCLALGLAACAPPHGESQTSKDGKPLTVSEQELEKVRQALAKNLPKVKVDGVAATQLPGVFEVRSGMNFGYVSADGRYLIEGDLSNIETGERLTEDRRRVARMELINAVPADQSIDFMPEDGKPKYTVTVFTDIDCGYCRKLHQHVAEYNKDSIGVRYLFFPRSGPDTESYYKAEKVWCSDDRRAALTKAKLGGPVEGSPDCANPVLDHLKMAAQLGLRGTPAIVLPDGELIPGYQTPEALLRALDAREAKAAASAPKAAASPAAG